MVYRWSESTDPADLGVVDAVQLLRAGELSSSELVAACLRRIGERDGNHSADGDPNSINAWVRVYEDDALEAAAAADKRLTEPDPPPLCGVPIGLKDLYAVKGKPLTASSSLLHEIPDADCDMWQRLRAGGMVLLGHTHTHEFAAGGTTDQVGNPWSLERSAGGSSGGSGAALAAKMVPAATGTDTAGSLRIPAALCGISTIKPTRGRLSIAGIVPLASSLDHPGPMARTVADCAALFAVMAGISAVPIRQGERPLDGVRLALSPRVSSVTLDDDVRDGFEKTAELCRALGATVMTSLPAPTGEMNIEHLTMLCTDMLEFHRRFNDERANYRASTREFLEMGERFAISEAQYAELQAGRRDTSRRWESWMATEGIDALLEPTVPVTAPRRGNGYDHAGLDADLVSLTYFWDWTGFPVVSQPAGVGRRSGLPVGVSLIGRPGTETELLAIGAALQDAIEG